MCRELLLVWRPQGSDCRNSRRVCARAGNGKKGRGGPLGPTLTWRARGKSGASNENKKGKRKKAHATNLTSVAIFERKTLERDGKEIGIFFAFQEPSLEEEGVFSPQLFQYLLSRNNGIMFHSYNEGSRVFHRAPFLLGPLEAGWWQRQSVPRLSLASVFSYSLLFLPIGIADVTTKKTISPLLRFRPHNLFTTKRGAMTAPWHRGRPPWANHVTPF